MPLVSDSLRNVSSSMVVAALLIVGLTLGKDILIPFTLAALLTFILTPIVRWMGKVRVPRGLAVTFVMLALVAGIVGFTGVVSNQIISLTAGLDSYRNNVVAKVRSVTSSNGGQSDFSRAADAVDALGTAIQREMSADPRAPAPTPPILQQDKPIEKPVEEKPESPRNDSGIIDYADTILGPFAKAGLTLLFTLFLLLQYHDLRDRVVRVIGTDHISNTTSAMSEAGGRLSKLFLMQALLNVSFGLFVGVTLWLIGIPNAVLWGILTAVMRFVPFIGSFLAAIPPILLAAAVDPGWGMFFATLAVFVIGEPLMGHVVEPLVLGKRAGISPFAMVASASFWTLVWGPVGLILAAPLTMGLIVLGRYVPSLEAFSVLLGDEPALSPPQELYHRMSSEDAVAAGQQIETALETASLATVADQLIMPALRLAADDMGRGRLDKEQIGDLMATSKTVTGLIRDDILEADRQIQNIHCHVLIVPARGAVDSIGAMFIAEVLGETLPPDMISRSSASGLTALSDAKAQSGAHPPDAIILASLSGTDERQLRFVLRRAVRDFPNARIMVLDVRSSQDSSWSHEANDKKVSVTNSVVTLASMLGSAGEANGTTGQSASDTPGKPGATPVLESV